MEAEENCSRCPYEMRVYHLKGWMEEARKADAATKTAGEPEEEGTKPEREAYTKTVSTGAEMETEAA